MFFTSRIVKAILEWKNLGGDICNSMTSFAAHGRKTLALDLQKKSFMAGPILVKEIQYKN